MKKKVMDIIPPQENTHHSSQESSEPVKLHAKRRGKLTLIVLGVFLLAFVISYFQFQRAEVVLVPRAESLSFIEDITLGSDSQAFDVVQKTIPSFVYEVTFSVHDSFESTGQVAQKAEGMVRVYNNFSTEPQVLVATTRFVSADGRLFRTPERVVIPGATQEGDRLVPGHVDILVVADQSGEEYNISPSTFSIPGFLGTSRYTAIYAKSFLPMEGGGSAPQVLQEDIERARQSLQERARQEGMQKLLEDEVPSNVVVVQNAPDPEILNVEILGTAGDEIPRFEASIDVRMRALGVLKSQLQEISEATFPLRVPQGHVPAEESIEFSWNVREGNVLELLVKGSYHEEIDIEELKETIGGYSALEAESYIETIPGVEESTVTLWPLWTQKVPSDLQRIHVNITLSSSREE